MRDGDRRKWNHQQIESRKTVEEIANTATEKKNEYKLLETVKTREDRLRK